MKIINFYRIEGAGPMVATFDIQLKPILIRGVALFRKESGEAWISEPTEKFVGRDGRIVYKKHVVFTDRKFREVIREAAKQHFESSPNIGDDKPF